MDIELTKKLVKPLNVQPLDLQDDANMSTEDVISVLIKGTSLHKVRYHLILGDKFYCRRYFIVLDNMRMKYSPSKKQNPYIDLCNISEVRKGWQSDRFNVIKSRHRRGEKEPVNLPILVEDNCFSLIFDNGTNTEDLVADNHHIRELWVNVLNYLAAKCEKPQRDDGYEYWLKEQFRTTDGNKNGHLSFEKLLALLNHLNISMNEKHAKALFNMVRNKHRIHLRSEDSLDQDEFLKFYKMINSRPELDKIFNNYSVNNTCIMGPEELLKFLNTEQKLKKITLTDCEAYIKQYEPKKNKNPGYLSISGFHNLFKSMDFDIFNKSHRSVCQEMFHPFSHYFVASSHNTYLTMTEPELTNQLTGTSSIEAYRMALIKGCRCVELDVLDGEDGEPIITHKNTWTTSIGLRDVLEIIYEYAFKATQYPLILSIENHCSVEQQTVMAGLMCDILKEYLYKTPVDDNEKHLPSPELLVRKILIKGKKLHREVMKLAETFCDGVTDAHGSQFGEKLGIDQEETSEEDLGIDESETKVSNGEVPGINAEVHNCELKGNNNEMPNMEVPGFNEEGENQESLGIIIENTEWHGNTVQLCNLKVPGIDAEDPNAEEITDSDDEISESETKEKLIIRRHTSPDLFGYRENNGNNEALEPLSGFSSKDEDSDLCWLFPTPTRQKPEDIYASNESSKEFSDLVTYCVTKKFVSFSDCFKKWKFNEMVSFEETKSEDLIKTQAQDYVKFNKNHLSRVYPNGIRVNSSNYNPIPHWNVGAQLVALNYQTSDNYMLSNDALFALNGKCGYVLKAEYLRKGQQFWTRSLNSVVNLPTNKLKRVKLKIISGQHLPKPGNSFDPEISDPYVEIHILDQSTDKLMFATKAVKNNGFNPIWNQKFEFTVPFHEMAFIYFAVKDTGKNTLLGQYMLAFPAIMQGYRHVYLADKDNEPIYPASLFVRVSFVDDEKYISPIGATLG